MSANKIANIRPEKRNQNIHENQRCLKVANIYTAKIVDVNEEL